MPCRVVWQSWSMVGPRAQITESCEAPVSGSDFQRLWSMRGRARLGDRCHSQSHC